MYKYDSLTCEVARTALEDDERRAKYKRAERLFLLMPLVQSENLDDSNFATQMIVQEREDAEKHGDKYKPYIKRLNNLYEQSEAVGSILEKFNRLPYRNEYMERETTEEEQEFLLANSDQV